MTFFGDPHPVWHDGPEISALPQTASANAATVVRMLAAGLDDRDPLAAESITASGDRGLETARSRHLGLALA